ncbi:hypothetical protein ES703_59939 [subsurface metagenome]
MIETMGKRFSYINILEEISRDPLAVEIPAPDSLVALRVDIEVIKDRSIRQRGKVLVDLHPFKIFHFGPVHAINLYDIDVSCGKHKLSCSPLLNHLYHNIFYIGRAPEIAIKPGKRYLHTGFPSIKFIGSGSHGFVVQSFRARCRVVVLLPVCLCSVPCPVCYHVFLVHYSRPVLGKDTKKRRVRIFQVKNYILAVHFYRIIDILKIYGYIPFFAP